MTFTKKQKKKTKRLDGKRKKSPVCENTPECSPNLMQCTSTSSSEKACPFPPTPHTFQLAHKQLIGVIGQ